MQKSIKKLKLPDIFTCYKSHLNFFLIEHWINFFANSVLYYFKFYHYNIHIIYLLNLYCFFILSVIYLFILLVFITIININILP